MRARALGVASLLLAMLPAGPTLAFDNPKALLQAIYAPMLDRQQPKDLSRYYSDDLKQMFAEHARQQADSPASAGQPAALSDASGFDPFVSGTNILLFDVNISDPVVIGDHAEATVSYHNFDHPALLTVSMVREAGGWKVDDVASFGPDQHWLLSWLLTHDPWASN